MRVRAGSENGGADERASEWGAKASASRGVEAAAAKPRAAAASLEFASFSRHLKPICQSVDIEKTWGRENRIQTSQHGRRRGEDARGRGRPRDGRNAGANARPEA